MDKKQEFNRLLKELEIERAGSIKKTEDEFAEKLKALRVVFGHAGQESATHSAGAVSKNFKDKYGKVSGQVVDVLKASPVGTILTVKEVAGKLKQAVGHDFSLATISGILRRMSRREDSILKKANFRRGNKAARYKITDLKAGNS